MRNTFDDEYYPVCNEDLLYPDEGDVMSAEEAFEEKLRKYQWRKDRKQIK